MSEPIRVVFIAGTGRSGSTILSNAISQLPGALGVGEVRYVWGRGMAEDHLCGCGQPFSRCPLWQGVTARAFDGRADLDPAAIASRLDSRLRGRRLPAQVWARLRKRPAIEPHADDEELTRLYQALADEAGTRYVIDSSKLPSYAALVESLPGVEFHLVHLVRDPRATTFSWGRVKATGDSNDRAEMPRLSLLRGALDWLLWNTLTRAWWPKGRRHVVRYEDFTADPVATMAAIGADLGIEVPDGLVVGHEVRLAPTHTVAGNPDRLRSGAVQLRQDTEWRTAMPAWQRAAVTVLTFPTLRAFGYRSR